MSSHSSPYDPPRAKGFGRLRQVKYRLRRPFYSVPFDLPVHFWSALAGAITPGYGFQLVGYRTVSWITRAVYGAAALFLLVRLGYPSANYAFVLMISLHAVSVLMVIRRYFPVETFASRIWQSAGILVAIIGTYAAGQMALGMAITPVRYGGKVFVVNRLVSAKAMAQGDIVAFRMGSNRSWFDDGGAHGTVILEGGYGFGDIMGTAGDQITFTKDALWVNGKAQPRRARMPEHGSLVLAENDWFIWPDFAISSHGQAAEEFQANEMLGRLGVVEKRQFVGKVFRHWFWRKQL